MLDLRDQVVLQVPPDTRQVQHAHPRDYDRFSWIRRTLGGWRRPVYRDGMALVSSSVLSSLVGLLYWVVAARLFAPAEVGVLVGLPAAVAALVLVGTWLLTPWLGMSGAGVALLGAQAVAALAVLVGPAAGRRA